MCSDKWYFKLLSLVNPFPQYSHLYIKPLCRRMCDSYGAFCGKPFLHCSQYHLKFPVWSTICLFNVNCRLNTFDIVGYGLASDLRSVLSFQHQIHPKSSKIQHRKISPNYIKIQKYALPIKCAFSCVFQIGVARYNLSCTHHMWNDRCQCAQTYGTSTSQGWLSLYHKPRIDISTPCDSSYVFRVEFYRESPFYIYRRRTCSFQCAEQSDVSGYFCGWMIYHIYHMEMISSRPLILLIFYRHHNTKSIK